MRSTIRWRRSRPAPRALRSSSVSWNTSSSSTLRSSVASGSSTGCLTLVGSDRSRRSRLMSMRRWNARCSCCRFTRVAVARDLGPSVMVKANADQLIQVLMALLLNAADATEQKGLEASVIVRTSVSSGTVNIEIIDNGVGIPRAEVGKLFEPFYTTKPPGRGTGLGLSICYGLVADHGGRLEVESTPGLGSTFRVVLPTESVV